MSSEASRLYDFLTDYTNGDPITDIKVDAELDNCIDKLNQKVLCKTTAPSSPIDGQTWVDTSEAAPLLKVRDDTNSQWLGVNPLSVTTAERDLLTAVNGMLIYNETLTKLQVYESSSWKTVTTS